MKHEASDGNVKGTVLLWSMLTMPLSGARDRNSGAGAVAIVFVTVVTAGVVVLVKSSAAGSFHPAFVFVPTLPKLVPVNVIVVPGHPVVGDTDVRCQADAAWALAKNTSRPNMLARRLARLAVRRPIAGHAATPTPRGALNILIVIASTRWCAGERKRRPRD